MRRLATVLTASLLGTLIGAAQSDDVFAGAWKLNPARSDIHYLPSPPDAFLKVQQTNSTLTIAASAAEDGPSTLVTYPLDGKPQKWQAGSSTMSTVTKWEGSALLVNTLVTGARNYTVMERWTKSRDGNTLKIKRTIVRLEGQSESTLVYENPAVTPVITSTEEPRTTSTPMLTRRTVERTTPPPDSETEYIVQSGTRVLLRLTNAVNTKRTAAGDRIYLETVVPVFVNQRLIIPRGSYVTGTVLDSKRAGRVKGKSELQIRFDSLTLPNGVTRDLRSIPTEADGRGNLDRKEGKIEGDGNKGGDARTIGETTAAGAGIGTLAGAATGHVARGLGIGSAAGA